MKTQLMMSTALLSLLALSGCQRAETPEVADTGTTTSGSLDSNSTATPDTASTDGVTSSEDRVASTGSSTDTDRSVGQTVDDASMTGKIKTALATDPTTKARNINVTTFEGTVSLSGFVDSPAERVRAEELAHQVKGVKEVRNELEVGRKP